MPMVNDNHQKFVLDRIAAYNRRKLVNDRINDVFTRAAKERNKRQEYVRDPSDNTQVPGWIIYEREQMISAVNAERSRLGKDPIDPKMVVQVESCAKGHSDYQRKYVLYCTELILDDWRGP